MIYSAINGSDENYARGELFFISGTPGLAIFARWVGKIVPLAANCHNKSLLFFFLSFLLPLILHLHSRLQRLWEKEEGKRKQERNFSFLPRLSAAKRTDLSIITAMNILERRDTLLVVRSRALKPATDFIADGNDWFANPYTVMKSYACILFEQSRCKKMI